MSHKLFPKAAFYQIAQRVASLKAIADSLMQSCERYQQNDQYLQGALLAGKVGGIELRSIEGQQHQIERDMDAAFRMLKPVAEQLAALAQVNKEFRRYHNPQLERSPLYPELRKAGMIVEQNGDRKIRWRNNEARRLCEVNGITYMFGEGVGPARFNGGLNAPDTSFAEPVRDHKVGWLLNEVLCKFDNSTDNVFYTNKWERISFGFHIPTGTWSGPLDIGGHEQRLTGVARWSDEPTWVVDDSWTCTNHNEPIIYTDGTTKCYCGRERP